MRNGTVLGQHLRPVLPLVIILGVAACGGDPTAPPETDTLMPTLSSIENHVFVPFCSTHRGPSDAKADLDLSVGQTFANLVNVPSTQVGLNRVTPGDADNSYLVHKIEGRAGIVGRQMPIGTVPSPTRRSQRSNSGSTPASGTTEIRTRLWRTAILSTAIAGDADLAVADDTGRMLRLGEIHGTPVVNRAQSTGRADCPSIPKSHKRRPLGSILWEASRAISFRGHER